MSRDAEKALDRAPHTEQELRVALFICALVCVAMMALILGTPGNGLGIFTLPAPFLLSGLLAYIVLARRTLTPSELEVAARVPRVGFGLFTAWFGLLFWAGFSSIYYTSLLQPPTEYCCLGFPTLPQGIALIPWLMLAAGSITAVLAALRPRVASLFEVGSLGLVLTLILAFLIPRPFYLSSGGYEVFGGLPLAWWGQSLGTCAGCNFYAGTALLAPFLLDWVIWTVLIGGLLCIIRLQSVNRLRRDSARSIQILINLLFAVDAIGTKP